MQIKISWLFQKPTDLDLHCLQRQGISGFSRTKVKVSKNRLKGISRQVFLLILQENLCCWYSLIMSWWYTSNEYWNSFFFFSSFFLINRKYHHFMGFKKPLIYSSGNFWIILFFTLVMLNKLEHEVSICSLIPPDTAISTARTTKGSNSQGSGPMVLIFFHTIKLVILVMCTKFQVSR